ncbi:hypothetical protein BpHYR1_007498 [Brachionus plicatilis]|uniref:Uncharacterized protein n=1 Tax=Brachionus plicatilis TaxID=10195 RepID=A0A3M7REM7_BRAPC|nr:hypothetical protein BpHYR1_007498 [Brachionus plicatilis]
MQGFKNIFNYHQTVTFKLFKKTAFVSKNFYEKKNLNLKKRITKQQSNNVQARGYRQYSSTY